MDVGYFNELFYGYAINAGGSRHPVGSLTYRVISGQCMCFEYLLCYKIDWLLYIGWYEAQMMLEDMKL